jgi:(p)ppGpp synthase/HD superfamily hydrolase
VLQSPCRGKEGVGLVHDVIEDSDITAEDLLAEGIPAEVVEVIQFLTKRKNEKYQEEEQVGGEG